ncbi:metallophosphoesterase family protein [Urechidicola sp. KH5]
MKKILLLSDTHGFIDEQILKYVKQADEVWHAGDIGHVDVSDTLRNETKLRAVYGNIDGGDLRKEFPLDQYFELEGVTVFITHIGGYPNRYNARVKTELTSKKPKLYICGHSHILKVQYDNNLKLLHMNPGAAGKHGFHRVRTMLRFELVSGETKNLEVIELGKRV